MTRENAADAILACLKAMPQLQRQIILLVRFENWGTSRIAAHLGRNRDEIDKALQDAMLALHKALHDPNGGEEPPKA